MSNLTRYKFKNICLDKGFIRGPFGSALKKSLFVSKSEDTYKVYEQCVPLEQDKSKGNYYITGDYFRKSLSRFEVKHNDFLVSCSGVNYGAIYHLKEPFEQGVINQALLIIRVNDKIVDYNYFKYLFKIVLSRAITTGTGDSTIPNFPSIDVIKDIDVYLPTIDVQQKIGAILNCIDEKIINNIHVSDYLQHMAKTLYDYWFVQFDFPDENGKPYRTSGGEMVWNEQLKREIPKEWESGKLCDIANITMGQSPTGESYNDIGDGVIFYQGRTDFGLRFPTPRMYTTAPARFAQKGDILLSVRAPVGDLNFAMEDCCIGRGLAALNSKLGSQMHLFYTLSGFQQIFNVMDGNGTTFGSITKDTLFDMAAVIPSNEILKCFEKRVKPIESKIEKCEEEIRELTKLRDWLLPMLMNGQVRVE